MAEWYSLCLPCEVLGPAPARVYMCTHKAVQTLGYTEQPVYGVHLVTGLQEGLVKISFITGIQKSSLDSVFPLVVAVGRVLFVAQAGPKQ